MKIENRTSSSQHTDFHSSTVCLYEIHGCFFSREYVSKLSKPCQGVKKYTQIVINIQKSKKSEAHTLCETSDNVNYLIKNHASTVVYY